MSPRGNTHQSTLPGIWKSPTFLRAWHPTAEIWLEGKQVDDNTKGLWRVHDDLYDLTPFIDKHPGGSEWLTLTKGTDITEAFESHHVRKPVQPILKKFWVCSATGPRFSPYTFHDKGFYRTLKRRLQPILATIPPGPSWRSKLTADLLLISSLLTGTIAVATFSYFIGIVSGLLFALTNISAHNFFHMRDNLRMYYFNFCFLNYRDWRVTHALSHHLFPNTMLDFEMFFNEQLLQWMPLKYKAWWVRFCSWAYSPILYSLHSHMSILKRLVDVFKTKGESLTMEIIVPFIPFIVMYIGSGASLVNTFLMWTWILLTFSFFFGFIGINAAHHHPDIFHDGDTPRVDRDWGLGQMDAVRDRPEISKSLFLVLVTFGEHCMHHMFPTVDHSYLHLLYPGFKETCKQFDIVHKPKSILELVTGQYQQLANNKPNPKPPGKVMK